VIKEALEYLVGLAPTETFEYEGLQYTSNQLCAVLPPLPDVVKLNTLESIALFVNGEHISGEFLISPQSVGFFGPEDKWCRKPHLARSVAIVPNFQPGGYQPHEQFILWVLTHFEDDAERQRLLAFAGNVRNESIQTSEDDGVTQIAAVKRGAKLKEEGWKNPVMLAPFRTFDEVAQPKSRFIFRIRDDLQMGLWTVEDNAWKLEAMRAIKSQLMQLGVTQQIYI